jgi:hypothetical protein
MKRDIAVLFAGTFAQIKSATVLGVRFELAMEK